MMTGASFIEHGHQFYKLYEHTSIAITSLNRLVLYAEAQQWACQKMGFLAFTHGSK